VQYQIQVSSLWSLVSEPDS